MSNYRPQIPRLDGANHQFLRHIAEAGEVKSEPVTYSGTTYLFHVDVTFNSNVRHFDNSDAHGGLREFAIAMIAKVKPGLDQVALSQDFNSKLTSNDPVIVRLLFANEVDAKFIKLAVEALQRRYQRQSSQNDWVNPR